MQTHAAIGAEIIGEHGSISCGWQDRGPLPTTRNGTAAAILGLAGEAIPWKGGSWRLPTSSTPLTSERLQAGLRAADAFAHDQPGQDHIDPELILICIH